MKRIKRMLSIMLIIALITLSPGSIISTSAAELITKLEQAKGSNYAQSPALIKALDEVFHGDVEVYSSFGCTSKVSMGIGSRIPHSTQYYVKSKATGTVISGWQCYIYANGVYNKLFGEWVGHGDGFLRSRKVISGGARSLSFDMLSSAGVRCGAYIRTTGNKDGSYNSNIGHSMIILAYDSTTITYLEGNADGKGLVRITTRTWSDFNNSLLTIKNRYIAHIVQPKDAIYEEMYHVCDHKKYSDTGKCLQCGEAFDWKSTFSLDGFGIYQVIQAVAPSLEAPYEALAAKDQTLAVGKRITVTGSYQNVTGQKWYAGTNEKGTNIYLPAQSVKYTEALPVEVVSRNFSPADHALLERKAQPVKGQVTSSYPIKKIIAYLNGREYASWTAPNQSTYSVELRNTDINHLLAFSALEKGRHTITLKMEGYLLEAPLTVHESAFFMEVYANCTHNYQSKVTIEPTCTQEGVRKETCTICSDQTTHPIPALGHQYQNYVCVRCGKTNYLELSGRVTSRFGEAQPTEVTLRKDSLLLAQVTVNGLSGTYSFQKLTPGSYTLEFHKDGAVPRRWELDLTASINLPEAALYRLGDVSGDDHINIGDVALLYAHVQNSEIVIELYKLLCGDLSADEKINIGDVAKLYAIIRGKK